MTQEQELHLQQIKDFVCEQIDKKYRKGVEEHGGNLWEKTGMVDKAFEEIIDIFTYLFVTKNQVSEGRIDLLQGPDND